MLLSYTLRLICLAIVLTGLLHALLELSLWIGAPLILSRLAAPTIRQRERLLYLLQLAPLLVSLLFVGSLCVPQYLRNETNLEPESVGWLCLLLASMASLWYGLAVLRGLRMAVRTIRFTAACERAGRNIESDPKRTPIFAMPVLAMPGPVCRIALAGLVHPFILISENLIEDGGLDQTALEIALDHECSHAAQFDNWKLFSLCFLPSLHLRLPGGSTWMQLWRRTAEWAADHDAVRGDSGRAFVLAETLIAVARPAPASMPVLLCTTLACGEADLAARVDRLIHMIPDSSAPRGHSIVFALAAAALAAGVAVACVAPWLHSLCEHILHLG
jgi:hypothetical protein